MRSTAPVQSRLQRTWASRKNGPWTGNASSDVGISSSSMIHSPGSRSGGTMRAACKRGQHSSRWRATRNRNSSGARTRLVHQLPRRPAECPRVIAARSRCSSRPGPAKHWWCYQSNRDMEQKNPQRLDLDASVRRTCATGGGSQPATLDANHVFHYTKVLSIGDSA